MRTFPICAAAFLALLSVPGVRAETSIHEKIEDAKDDTVVISKGNPKNIQPDFEVVNSSSDISGDPTPELKDAYDTWKAACKEWKADMEKNNAGNIISLSCGSAGYAKEANGRYLYKSTATYKVRVRIRDSKK